MEQKIAKHGMVSDQLVVLLWTIHYLIFTQYFFTTHGTFKPIFSPVFWYCNGTYFHRCWIKFQSNNVTCQYLCKCELFMTKHVHNYTVKAKRYCLLCLNTSYTPVMNTLILTLSNWRFPYWVLGSWLYLLIFCYQWRPFPGRLAFPLGMRLWSCIQSNVSREK